jgi:nucleoid DNA-binding protein
VIKADLVARLADRFALSQTLATAIVRGLLDDLTAGILSGTPIELRRFGVFRIRQQRPRVIVLPSGKKITRPAHKVLTFAPSPTMKRKLNPPPPPKPRSPTARKRRS